MTDRDLFAALQCPACSGGLAYEPALQRAPEAGACGLLRCACATYPVLDGIPILVRDRLAHRSIADDRIIADGPTPEAVIAHIRAGEGLRALVDLLAFPVCPWPLNRIGAMRRLSVRGPQQTLGLAYRRRRIRRMLARRQSLTAEDWLDAFYWHAPVPYDPFNYFFFRYGQPRYVAALGLLSALPAEGAPILDLACGYGHHLHTVTTRGRAAVGVDQNVHHAWVARHYIAPEASFVCADADRPLPFREGTFGAALCTDAFYCLREKASILSELGRCAGGGPVLLAGTGNALVPPPDGDELTPGGYAALFEGWQWRVLAEPAIVASYLARRGPDLSASSPEADVARSKWLYYAAARDPDAAAVLLRDHGPLAEWPHAAGSVQVNPLYDASGDRLTFEFPSPWYRAENEAMRAYMPASASAEKDTQEARLKPFVLVGLPERYARPQGRPWTFRANRALGRLVGRLRS